MNKEDLTVRVQQLEIKMNSLLNYVGQLRNATAQHLVGIPYGPIGQRKVKKNTVKKRNKTSRTNKV